MDNFSRNKILIIVFLLTALFVSGDFLFLTNVNAEEIPDFPTMFEMPGTIESSGAHFEITNSEYLNISLDSSEQIKLRMESIPEMITMMIEPITSSTVTSTQITLSGLAPLTKYYKYQDDYHNLTEFITDENGNHSYFQDLLKPHFVFIQPRKSTKFIKDDATGGDCLSIGVWDINGKTCTLTTDISETIQIDSNGITLDGNRRTITGNYTGYGGVYIPDKINIVIKNLNIINFPVGIVLSRSNNNTFIDNTFNLNRSGIAFYYSSGNTLVNNISGSNTYFGIYLSSSNDNTLVNNNISSNQYGAAFFDNSLNNNFKENIVSNNNYGVYIRYSKNNKIYNNNFVNNLIQAEAYFYSTDNVFNMAMPVGGNYWNNFDTPAEGCSDSNNNNFCDSPYYFSGGQDNLPWTKQDSWKIPVNQSPTIFNLKQFKSDTILTILEGGITTESIVVLKTTLNDADNDKIKLQIELKEFNQSFDEQNLLESGFVNSTSEAIIIRTGLIDGQYHWRARAVDSQGNASQWQEFGIAGNMDFEVKLVPLYTQVESDYPSREATRIWSRLNYGIGYYSDCLTKKNPSDPNDPTMYSNIARCGCAITSKVMLGRYYGINIGIDNNDVDPANINNWLTDNNGYTNDGRLYWGKAIEYLGFVENGVKKVKLSLDYFNATFTLPVVENYIASAKLAISYSSKFGHYFIVDGKIKDGQVDTYTIKDPRWYNTKTLNQSENLANEIRGYNNYFDTVNLFSYLETPKKLTASIYLYLSSPAELFVTDPLGRKLGEDPILNLTYNEIPSGSYTQEGPIITSDTPLDPNQIHKTKAIYISTPIEGNYDIRVIGTNIGSYELNTFTYDNQGNSLTQTSIGNTQTNLNIDYNLNFTPDAPEDIVIQPEDTEAPVISHTSINNQYILNLSPITFNFSAQDSGTGIFKLSATLDGQPLSDGTVINFNQIGEHTIMIEAEDFVGNKRTETIAYKVIYDFSGFLPPIKLDGTGIYKKGRTLLVKFQLKDANGVFISTAIAKLYVAKIQNGIVGSDETPLSTSNADTGNLFRYDVIDNQYIYNLSTNSLSIGSWQLKVVLDDRKPYTVVVLLR